MMSVSVHPDAGRSSDELGPTSTSSSSWTHHP